MTYKGKTKINRQVILRACKEAKKSSVKRGKVGAVIFTDKGRIITSAHNATFWGDKKIFTIHAEEFLLAKAARMKIFERYGDTKLCMLVVRYKKSSEYMANAKPCSKCQVLLREADIKVFYSNEDGFIETLEFDAYNVVGEVV